MGKGAKPAKYLVETSAVRAAIGHSTPPQQEHFRHQIADGELWSSVYVRMEFIRRWVCDLIYQATVMAQCTTVDHGLTVLEQDFSQRANKAAIFGVSEILREKGVLTNSRAAAEEYLHSAVGLLRTFDGILGRRTNNACKCKIGGWELKVDFNQAVLDLEQFRKAFLEPVKDCEVNAFLKSGKASKLLADKKVAKLKVAKRMSTLLDQGTWVTCKECASVADLVIALDQPASWWLAHVDAAFTVLCDKLGTRNKPIKSVLALEKERRVAGDKGVPGR